MEFEQYEKPQILQHFAMEDYESAARSAAEDRMLRRHQAETGIALQESQIERNRRPPAAPKLAPQLRLGRDRRTGELDYYDAGDPQDRANYDPAEFPKEERPDRRFTDRGMVDVSKLSPEELRKLRPYQRPRAGRQPKAEQKFVSISKVREFAEQHGISESDAAAQARADGYTIVR